MSEVDAALGRLFAFLKETGRWDNTLIVFTSDHGEQMGDHWLLGKCGYFDASYRIPLIVRDPRAPGRCAGAAASSNASPRMSTSCRPCWRRSAPTFRCNAMACRCVRSWKDAARPPNWRSEAHWEYDFRDPADDAAEKRLDLTLHQCTMNIIRDERYKYVHFTKLPPLLFDLKKDPGEFVNRAQRSALSAGRAGIRAETALLAHEPRRADADPHFADP